MQTPESASTDYEYISPIGYSYYANATSLSPRFYQNLLDRCWRRSGKLMYRPNQKRSCCPHYTIRLDSSQFKPSRDQRQTVNRFTKFVLGDAYIKEAARLYPKTREDIRRRDNEFSLTGRIHEAEYDHLKTPLEPTHKFVVTLENDDFTEEKYQVYDNYQRVVHRDPPEDRTPRAFKRFLCSSPIRREVLVGAGGRKRRLGSYHQCYRLDGVLVAIGVLDLLPNCVSSVYFLYHESIHKNAPGKLGALHEIALASEEGYQWWYPGFYIHNCPKMKYKIDYSPQFILDPDSLCWDPLDSTVLRLLNQKPFLSLSVEKHSACTSGGGDDDHHGDTREAKRPNVGESGKDSMGTIESDDDGEGKDEEDIGSLFKSGMPGISSASDMMEVDLDHIALKIYPEGPLFETSDLVAWDSKSITDWPGIKASVAELVAALGPEAVQSLCLDMTRGG
ncbi:hypothetical protein EsDP_00004568 [Epichloe bromicola]|uniref:arginyltransferase n=1 Tax=Epichloe bromicola TaxID=79588 RepID=A0ABQ0CS47_9HYPO